ncbi:MAG TPA: hypothetical protein DCQ37_11115 [Desulfobacteraceae bacterium]|nr:hypothetical protein [Desulfobacteraceae bacterium]
MNEDNRSQKSLCGKESCRAKWVIEGKISECTNMPIRGCRYAFPFGDEHFCLHPMREDIVRKTSL